MSAPWSEIIVSLVIIVVFCILYIILLWFLVCTKALDILRDVLVTYGDKEMEALRVKELKDLRVGQAYIVFDENRRVDFVFKVYFLFRSL